MDDRRSERVREAIREELSEIIAYEMEDPRVQSVEVTEVLLSPDLRHARVRLHLEGDEKGRAQCLAALSGARRFLRRQLAVRIRLYRTPELHFEPDVICSGAPREGAQAKFASPRLAKKDQFPF
ncbi:MAG: 30S ribosome-binding factor RbfA [Bryobacteraceae bacterium]